MHLVREGAVLAPSSLWVHHTLFSGPAHPATNVAIETRFGYRLPPTFHFGSSHCSEKESRRIALDLSTRPTMYHSLLLRQRSVRAPWPSRCVLIIQKCFFFENRIFGIEDDFIIGKGRNINLLWLAVESWAGKGQEHHRNLNPQPQRNNCHVMPSCAPVRLVCLSCNAEHTRVRALAHRVRFSQITASPSHGLSIRLKSPVRSPFTVGWEDWKPFAVSLLLIIGGKMLSSDAP